MIRIGLGQFNPMVGDIAGNLRRMVEMIREAGEQNVDLLAFPELALIGYPPKDLLFDSRLLQAQAEALRQIQDISRGMAMTIVLGAALPNPGPGKPLFNGLLAIQGGKVPLSYHKQLLPTYDVFDERRYFETGPRKPAILQVAGHRVGLLICEDAWNFEGSDYVADPLADLKEAGAQVVVSINASPFFTDKPALRERTILRAGLPVAYVNQVGGNDDLVFDGHSFFGDNGTVKSRARGFSEELTWADFDGRQFTPASPMAVREDASAEAQTFQALALGLRDYLAKTGFQSVVVGSSGGIDSALVLAICALALGPDRVTAITMPSKYSSAGSVEDSQELCDRLGVRLISHPIPSAVDAFEQGFEAAFATPLVGLAAENLQARIRGTVLMEYSNAFGALLISTGNKSEMSVGYCTLYGDMNGGIGLIGDLYKTDVYRLARWINQTHRDPIPVAILDKAPSAELAPDQTDQDSLPPYEVLDSLLKELLEGAPPSGTAPDTRARVAAMLARAEFKRRQAPPIIKVRSRSFGSGRQFPIAARYPS